MAYHVGSVVRGLQCLAYRRHRHDNMKDLRCMSYMSKGNAEILVAGCQDVMFKIDVEKGRIVEEVPLPACGSIDTH